MAGRPESASRQRSGLKRNPPSRYATAVAANKAAELPKERSTCGKELERNGRSVGYTEGLHPFNSPTPSPRIPSRIPMFDQRGSSPLPAKMSRSRTYQELPLLQPFDDPPRIGRAFGSPFNLKTPPTWGRSQTSDVVNTRITTGLPSARLPPPAPRGERSGFQSPETKKNNKSSWKAFGTLFRSKTTKEPFYKVKEQSITVVTPVAYDALSPELEVPELLSPNRPSTPLSCLLASSPGILQADHSSDSLRSRAVFRPEQRSDTGNRTSLMPKGLGLRTRGVTPTSSRRVNSPGLWRFSEDAFKQRYGRRDMSLCDDDTFDEKALPVPRTPRLVLDLPALEFPRYSIMFEKQLSNGSRPSILERRESKLQYSHSQTKWKRDDCLQVDIHGAGIKRSKTSPSFKRTLSIQVKEEQSSPEKPTMALHRPRQITRSVTAPPGVMSPIAAAFMRARTYTHQSSSPESPSSAFYSENSPPTTPTTATTCTDTDSVRRILDQAEPMWGIPTSQISPARPPTNRSQSHSHTAYAACPFSIDDDQPPTYRLQDIYPRVKSPEDLERQIAQASVARQVSVSRARTRVMRAMEGIAKPAAVPLRPRIIEFANYRKSAIGVFEDAAAETEDVMPDNAAAHSRAASLAFDEANRKSMMSVNSVDRVAQEEVPDLPDLEATHTHDDNGKSPIILLIAEAKSP